MMGMLYTTYLLILGSGSWYRMLPMVPQLKIWLSKYIHGAQANLRLNMQSRFSSTLPSEIALRRASDVSDIVTEYSIGTIITNWGCYWYLNTDLVVV